MIKKTNYVLPLYCLFIVGIAQINAQNPIIRDQFTADPSARVFSDKVFLFPSHDILCNEEHGQPGWFCMEDYHVFSSDNLSDWTDHGIIVNQEKVAWANPTAYSMWAPDCIFRNGKYYFYFPTITKDTSIGKGFMIGIASATNPQGPYSLEENPIKDVHGIDPNVLIDKDGQAYLYWSHRNIFGAKLKENMLELNSEVHILEDLPTKGLKEGPFVFERSGIYYLTYPHVKNKTERLEYAIGNNPLGPFKVAGVIMDELPSGCWTNHHSIVEFKGQWYLFYHDNDLSPLFDKNRSVRVDSLFFNDDGTIQKVNPTFRGVGITDASQNIEIDRYSLISNKGVSVEPMDSSNAFSGWKTIFSNKDAWLKYNAVGFRDKNYKSIQVKVLSLEQATIQILLDDLNGQVLSEIELTGNKDWQVIQAPLLSRPTNIHNIIVRLGSKNHIEIDWLKFLK